MWDVFRASIAWAAGQLAAALSLRLVLFGALALVMLLGYLAHR